MASGGDSPIDGGLHQGAALTKADSTQKWANLPPPVFHTLCSMMDRTFLHTARQVCPQWLSNTEQEVGLRVKIDDTVSGNLEFIQSVKVTEARVVNWSDTSYSNVASVLLFPTCLSKLTLSGKIENLKASDLKQLPSLSHLVLRGAALHTQDMTGLPLPTPSSAIPTEEGQALLEAYEPQIETSPIYLRRLEKLEIIMNEFSYPSVLPLSVRLYQPDRAIEHDAMLKHLYLVVLNNVTYFLNNVRSSCLKTVQFYIYPKAGTLPPSKINWRHKPLQRFLANHKKTLRDVFLPDFEGKHDNTENDILTFPVKLRKLQIALSKYIGDREESRQQNLTYWKKFLMEQSGLVDVYAILSDLPSQWINESITSFVFGSKETLTYADIVIEHSEDTVQINLEIFSFCHKLQVLKLSGRDNEIMIFNFCKLPTSLKKVYVSLANVELPEGHLISKFVNLEMLELKTVAIGGGGTDHQQRNSRTLEMILEFLKLRKLSLLALVLDSPLNTNPEAMSLLAHLDQDFDVSYPTFTIKLHLSYEIEAGWSEEAFDEDTLQIEYINTREPEEYTAWQSRHRNAISVDDEDHRIFIFQTLPFLVDIRGLGAQEDGDDWNGEMPVRRDEPDSDDSLEPTADDDDSSDE